MTFAEWYKLHPLWDVRLPVVETWLAQCWDDATQAERKRCAQIAYKYDENGMTLVRIEHPERYKEQP